MGRNFDDCPGFQPKTTPAQRYNATQCTYVSMTHFYDGIKLRSKSIAAHAFVAYQVKMHWLNSSVHRQIKEDILQKPRLRGSERTLAPSEFKHSIEDRKRQSAF